MDYKRLFFASSILTALSLFITGCVISTPFKGPGYSRWDGIKGAQPTDEFVVVLTYAKLDRNNRKAFDEGTARVHKTMSTHDGLIGHSIRKEILGDEAWTITVWKDEASVENFSKSEIHRQAVTEGRASLVATKFRRLTLPASQIPLSWKEAEKYLENPDRSYGQP
jgi:heme-degrading monooxygenase HmoA